MKKLISTKKYFITAIILFVILFSMTIFSLFIISKEKEKVKAISKDLTIANKEDVVTLKRAIRNYEASADYVQDMLVDKDEIFLFITDIERLAQQSGAQIAVQNVDLFDVLESKELVRSTGQENPDRTHGKFMMSAQVTGDWEEVSTFLLKVENLTKHSVIETFRLNSVFDAQTGKQSWTANLNLITTTN